MRPAGSGSGPPGAGVQTLRRQRANRFELRPAVLNRTVGGAEPTFDPAHGVDDERRLSAFGASAPQRLQGFQVTGQVGFT